MSRRADRLPARRMAPSFLLLLPQILFALCLQVLTGRRMSTPIRRAVARGAALVLIQRTLSRPAAPLRGVRRLCSFSGRFPVLPRRCMGCGRRCPRRT